MGQSFFDAANIERFLFSNKKNEENSGKIIIFVLHYMSCFSAATDERETKSF